MTSAAPAPSIVPDPRISAAKRPGPQPIIILGGGFGGVCTARNLEKIFRRNPNVQITLLARDNCFLMTPFLFDAGKLDLFGEEHPTQKPARAAKGGPT